MESPSTAIVVTTELGSLPGLQQTHDPALRLELERLRDQHATPLGLQTHRLDSNGVPRPKRRIADRENAAAAMRCVFTDQRRLSLAARLDRILPTDFATTPPQDLSDLRDIVRNYRAERSRFFAAIAKPACDLRWEYAKGILADTSAVEAFRVATRLETAAVFVAWHDQPAWDARPSFDVLFRAIEFLADEFHLVPRLAACDLRRDVLRLAEYGLRREPIDVALAEHLRASLTRQLEQWPLDRQAWLGAQADGLVCFEMVRHGQLLSLFTTEQLREFQSSGKLQAVVDHTMRTVDADELFFLQICREILSLSDLPPSHRRAAVREIEEQLATAKRSGHHPFVAVEMLLNDFLRNQQSLFDDRAACERLVAKTRLVR